MTKAARRLEELFVEITFAEDRVLAPAQKALSKARRKIEDAFTAVTFAEAGEFETARNSMNRGSENPQYRRARRTERTFARFCTSRI